MPCVRKEKTREGDAGRETPTRRTPGRRGRRPGRGCWRIGRGRGRRWPGRGTGRRGRHLRRGHMRAVPQRGDRHRRRATQARETPAGETFTQGRQRRGRRPRRGLWRAIRPRGDRRPPGRRQCWGRRRAVHPRGALEEGRGDASKLVRRRRRMSPSQGSPWVAPHDGRHLLGGRRVRDVRSGDAGAGDASTKGGRQHEGRPLGAGHVRRRGRRLRIRPRGDGSGRGAPIGGHRRMDVGE